MVLPPPLRIKLCNSSELHCKDTTIILNAQVFVRLFCVLAYFFMLFLCFLHKITPNCKVIDYKTATFCTITFSLATCSRLRTISPVGICATPTFGGDGATMPPDGNVTGFILSAACRNKSMPTAAAQAVWAASFSILAM